MHNSRSHDLPRDDGHGGEDADFLRLQVPLALQVPTPDARPAPSPVEVAPKLHPFIRGPIDLGWMTRAAGISHATAVVGLMLWHLRSLQRSRTVRLEPRWYGRFGVHRHTVRRSLVALEQAGLVHVEQQPGLPAEVTLLAREPRNSCKPRSGRSQCHPSPLSA